LGSNLDSEGLVLKPTNSENLDFIKILAGVNDKLSSNYLNIMSIQNANVIHPFYTRYQLDYVNLLMAQKFYYLIEFLKKKKKKKKKQKKTNQT